MLGSSFRILRVISFYYRMVVISRLKNILTHLMHSLTITRFILLVATGSSQYIVICIHIYIREASKIILFQRIVIVTLEKRMVNLFNRTSQGRALATQAKAGPLFL